MEQIEIQVKCQQCGALNLVTVSQTQANTISCSECKFVLLQYEPVRGYLYVLSNEHMPGLVKIGFSTRPVEERVAELNSSTAVPARFIIEGIFVSSAPEKDEQAVHERLASNRIPGKEFFRTELPETLQIIAQVCGGPPKYLRNPSLLTKPHPSILEPPIPEPPTLIRARKPKEDTLTLEEKEKRLRKWQEKMYQKKKPD
jgi:hypothetical protein